MYLVPRPTADPAGLAGSASWSSSCAAIESSIRPASHLPVGRVWLTRRHETLDHQRARLRVQVEDHPTDFAPCWLLLTLS